MRYEVTFHGQVSTTTDRVTPPPAEELEMFVDEVVGELEELVACDIDVSTDLMQGTVRVSVSVDTHGIERAQEEGSARIRAAFHAAGASTPDWSVEWMAVSTAAQDQVNA